MAKEKQNFVTDVPQYEIEAIARCLLPVIQKYFESAEGKREFEEWKGKDKEKNK